MQSAAIETVLAHVPSELVVDFDYMNMPGHTEDVHLAWSHVHSLPDIFWSPRYGGHWVATRAEDIEAIQVDYDHFSMQQVTVPATPGPPMLPLNFDPPRHTPFRNILAPAFGPRPIQALEHDVRELTRELLDSIAPRGECDFVDDFAKRLPIVTFLKLVDLPLSDREHLLKLADKAAHPASDSDQQEAFDGPRSPHAGFGDGPHRCPGSFLARMELRIFLEEWLPRIPDFEITPGKKPRTVGAVSNGMLYLPLSWHVRA